MTSKALSLKDVFLATFSSQHIFRYAPNAASPGGYEQVWMLSLPEGRGIGMTDDGKYLYAATWGGQTVERIIAETGVYDNVWKLKMNTLGVSGGDMESLSLRVKGNRKSLIIGYADAFIYSGAGGNFLANGAYGDWAEVDIATRTLLRVGKNPLGSRGCDWVWVINPDEFVTGCEANIFAKINLETGVATEYMPAAGGTSYTIEVRKGRLIAVTGNAGPVVLGHTDALGHNPVVDRSIQINPYNSTYFASSLESDGQHFWFSSYDGRVYGTSQPNDTPVWRVNALTGEGSTQPQFFIPGSEDVNGIYCLSHARESNLTGTHLQAGVRFDPSLDASRRLAVGR